MPKKNQTILQILAKDSKLSKRALAEKVGLPISTVHRRIVKLEHEGIIKGYKAIIAYEKTKTPVSALLFINISETIPEKGHIPKSTLIQRLLKYREIHELLDVIGSNFDLIIKARFASLKNLSIFMEELREIEGIEELSSAIITEEIL